MVQFKIWQKGENASRDILVKEMEILPLDLLEEMYKQVHGITCSSVSSVRFHNYKITNRLKKIYFTNLRSILLVYFSFIDSTTN